MCGLDLAAIYKPCHEIGGDLYDFFAIDDTRIIVSIADVIGKGVPAAIMMSMFRGRCGRMPTAATGGTRCGRSSKSSTLWRAGVPEWGVYYPAPCLHR
jgi:hypothetical protein